MPNSSIEALVEQFDGSKDPSVSTETLHEIRAIIGNDADFDQLLRGLQDTLVQLPESERILINLQRFLSAAKSRHDSLEDVLPKIDSLRKLIRLFSISQYLSDLVINQPKMFLLEQQTDGEPRDPQTLSQEIEQAVLNTPDRRSAYIVLRDFRHRETLRIAFGDFILGQPVDTVTRQLSILAQSVVRAAVAVARRDLNARMPVPRDSQNEAIAFCVLALGKLGGEELNYSSDIDLIFIHDSSSDRSTWTSSAGRSTDDEYFQRLGQLVVKYIGDSTEQGIAYRVDMRLRPHGDSGPLVFGYRDAVGYYDSMGRTWERQAFIKARPIAGDEELGRALVEELQPWVYRRYLMRADITGIAALKRRIENRALYTADGERNIKLGRGGIRDIEYVLQFLQLLHGSDQPDVRCGNTLDAIRRLQGAGCITAEEQDILESNYRFLRRVEHVLQIMFDRRTHSLPSDVAELQRVACHVEGHYSEDRLAEKPGDDTRSDAHNATVSRFEEQLVSRTSQNRQVLDHLLHDAFSSYGYDSSSIEYPESDLVLDPEPPPEVITNTLAPYGFTDCEAAYRHIQELASETIPFLSTRRSRHFLAAIAPRLMSAIAATPNPDATLISLANVSASLGGKAVLWELFSAHPPSMTLCLQLCATSPYLASILTSNPGMIDELMDSLMLDSLPTHDELAESLEGLCRNAVDIAPMLHSFKNSMHLRVGVRDILGKSTITETHAALSDIAEVCMEQVIHNEYHRLVHQKGVPSVGVPGESEQTAELVVLAVGKLGGREPNYHSDLDVIFLFDEDGSTKSLVPNRRFEPTTNRHFFNQLSQRVIQAVTHIGTTGQLYEIDVRLRPLGRSGQLAITIDDLQRYFLEGGGQIWERQALCKARPIWGSARARSDAMQCILRVLSENNWEKHDAQQIYDHRIQLQNDAAHGNLKRGVGGTMDVEFIVQLLQLANVKNNPGIVVAGTLEAITRLESAQLLDSMLAQEMYENYKFLRSIESGIRLMNLSARHELPDSISELEKLAFLLKSENRSSLEGRGLAEKCQQVRNRNREIFENVFAEWLPNEVDEIDEEIEAELKEET